MLAVEGAPELARRIRNAGTVFVGTTSSGAFGDYLTGANHVLPTAGAARAWSGLSTLDFVRWTTVQTVSRQGAASLARRHRRLRHRRGAARPRRRRPRLEDAVSPARPRPVLTTLPLYAPDPSPVEIDLSDNVNMWGVPPAAARALAGSARRPSERLSRTRTRVELREALAAYAGVSAAQVITGCGSDDVIDGALRAFAAPGEKVAYSAPSFSMLVNFTRVNGLEPAPVPFRKDGDIDPDALLGQRAAITYICSPNNPTGSGVSAAAIERGGLAGRGAGAGRRGVRRVLGADRGRGSFRARRSSWSPGPCPRPSGSPGSASATGSRRPRWSRCWRRSAARTR